MQHYIGVDVYTKCLFSRDAQSHGRPGVDQRCETRLQRVGSAIHSSHIIITVMAETSILSLGDDIGDMSKSMTECSSERWERPVMPEILNSSQTFRNK